MAELHPSEGCAGVITHPFVWLNRPNVGCGVDGYSVETESMSRAAQAVDGATVEIHRQLATLQQHADATLAQWRGRAAKAFSGTHAAFAEEGQRLNNALRNMREILLNTGTTYRNQEDEHVGGFDSISSQL
jgi:WXG100 family type VII secretion target